VNAAGITHYTALFKTLPDILERVVHTNLMGTMMGCRSIGRRMMGKQAGGGSSCQKLTSTYEECANKHRMHHQCILLTRLQGRKGECGIRCE
jgi:NAD(P)-dependent dehydrogenase (short-subunit alcohol dehydrogenase family)